MRVVFHGNGDPGKARVAARGSVGVEAFDEAEVTGEIGRTDRVARVGSVDNEVPTKEHPQTQSADDGGV